MANIKISELNELLPGQKAYDDYLAIVDSSADETKKISVETLTSTGVKLIAVSSTEPIEFSNGDKYYNTTNNRIYEARTDVWYNPQEPVEGIFYIIFDSQSIYTYDKTNEMLVSVGGGSNIEIVNNYSTSQTDGYSCNYLNTKLNSYSTTEQIIGTWTDGKPIYRKCFIGNDYADGTVLLTNISNLVNAYGTGDPGTGDMRQMPYFEWYNNSKYCCRVALYQNKVTLDSILGGSSHSAKLNLTLEYTKTTD